ncbi:dynein regulatory complex subunit 5 [Cololabis saira]|uniref:dynein regulatory complex subunit 5 n=1 Tax=Cololabis saira TaxID=129043 RepID=UPI002AD20BB8|nr:dynein regulatory complex subunit 5 [Cololabis saira]
MRRIFADIPNWTLELVPRLSSLCLESIANHFEENPIFEKLPPTEKNLLLEKLSPSLPLHVTSDLPDAVYWKRCCEQRWDLCDVSLYDNSWKRMLFERHMENIIENFIPNVSEPKTVLEMVPLCKNYVKRLDIKQLLPPNKEPQRGMQKEDAEEDDFENTRNNRFDFSILLDKMTNLEELHLVYKVINCGMDFEWSMFEITDRECEFLGTALKSCKTLKLFRLYQSHVDDTKCELLVKHLLDHPSLRELDFSHNQIGDSGAKAISKLLPRSKLETLKMWNNQIGSSGAKAIARALSKSSTLLSLNLRLNRVMDEGGLALGKALLTNTSLCHLDLGGNNVTGLTAFALSEVLVENKTLRKLNLSCNVLGEVGGKALAEAMSQNTSVTECDIRLTEVDEQSASCIEEAVRTNHFSEYKSRRRQPLISTHLQW